MTRTDIEITAAGRRVTGVGTGSVDSGAPLIVALPGGGYNARYFDLPRHSLLEVGAATGFQVVALNRPGYAGSERLLHDSVTFAGNAEMLDHAIGALWERVRGDCPGIVVIAHSIGAAVAVHLAARGLRWPLLGVALSGLSDFCRQPVVDLFHAMPPGQVVVLSPEQRRGFMYGPDDTVDADVLEVSAPSMEPVPVEELLELTGEWATMAPELVASVRVPVFSVLACFDHVWEIDQAGLDRFNGYFTGTSRLETELLRESGHNIDHHHVGRALHLGQLSFAWACAFDR